MRRQLLNPTSKAIRQRTHRRFSRRTGIAADFGRQINQRNDDGNCADDLADCANRFPIHGMIDRKSTRLNSSHRTISYAVFCLKKKIKNKKKKIYICVSLLILTIKSLYESML